MSLLVRPCHRRRFHAVLNDCFRLRRELFGSAADCDGADGDPALHLINLDVAGRAIATVRIRPAPGHPRRVEMAWLCADRRLAREERLRTLVELRAAMGLLFLRHGWSEGVVVGHDRHIQPFILSGMTVQALGPPVLPPGDNQPSFVVLVTDPDGRALAVHGSRRLEDPDEDPSLFTRYGDRAVA